MVFADLDRATNKPPIRPDCESMIDNVQMAFNAIDMLNSEYKQQPKIIRLENFNYMSKRDPFQKP